MRWDRRNKDRMLAWVAEMCIASGLMVLIFLVVFTNYERITLRGKIETSYAGMKVLLEALELYSIDNPSSPVFPPDLSFEMAGIVLCPIPDPSISLLHFLTTPVSYLERTRHDPFMTKVYGGDEAKSAGVIHWVFRPKDETGTKEYRHFGWGVFSIGPSLRLPPAYTAIFQSVPYQTLALEKYCYHPSNGLRSPGLLYMDSLGNHFNFAQ